MTTRTVYLYDDVPNELIDCIRMIDYSRIPKHEQQSQLQKLEDIASKQSRLQRRVTGNGMYPTRAVSVPSTLPDAAIDLVNTFWYGALRPTEKLFAYGAIKLWIKRNLPTV